MRHTPICSLFAVCLALSVSSASASVIFSDNFNDETPGLDVGLKNFTKSGTIDVIPLNGQFDLYPGNGLYIDLDGSNHVGTDPTSTLTSIKTFDPGTYTVSFNLGGSLRHDVANTTQVQLGDTVMSFTLSDTTGFTFQSFTAVVSGSPASLIFEELGPSDNRGNILDNVSVATMSVPLPASAPMFGAGLIALSAAGYAAKRKKAAASA